MVFEGLFVAVFLVFLAAGFLAVLGAVRVGFVLLDAVAGLAAGFAAVLDVCFVRFFVAGAVRFVTFRFGVVAIGSLEVEVEEHLFEFIDVAADLEHVLFERFEVVFRLGVVRCGSHEVFGRVVQTVNLGTHAFLEAA